MSSHASHRAQATDQYASYHSTQTMLKSPASVTGRPFDQILLFPWTYEWRADSSKAVLGVTVMLISTRPPTEADLERFERELKSHRDRNPHALQHLPAASAALDHARQEYAISGTPHAFSISNANSWGSRSNEWNLTTEAPSLDPNAAIVLGQPYYSTWRRLQADAFDDYFADFSYGGVNVEAYDYDPEECHLLPNSFGKGMRSFYTFKDIPSAAFEVPLAEQLVGEGY